MRHSGWYGSVCALAGALLVALAMHGARAGAAEVVVQNDSVVDFSQAVIVGGFVFGEEGGARLTSPCNGSIVAVQILWWAGNPGALPYLAQNIWIRRAETFPAPGDVLQQLDAPVLQAFALNEFRFTDEGGTVPLNVPVVANQQVAVTLEFSELADPFTGSILRDVDGCQPGKNLLFAPNLGGWVDFCGFPVFLQGDLVFRVVVDCLNEAGACCLTTGACVENLSPADCTGIAGVFQGNGTDCNAIQCPTPEQACCFMPAGCIDLLPSSCDLAGGSAQGEGSSCATVTCFPTGACCLVDGSCLDDVSPEACAVATGVFRGDGSTCAAAACPQPSGACCLAAGGCLELEQADCAVIPQSAWSGPLTDCTDADQNGTADACEVACGTPTQDVDQDCDVDLIDYVLFLQCATGPSEQTFGACLCYDSDGDGDVDLLDFGALSATFTGTGVGCP